MIFQGWTKRELLCLARAHGEMREHPDMTWWAVYTNPRCENRVELRLLEDGLCTYQPEGMIWNKPRHATVHVRRWRPAAPRYLFIADPERREPRWFNISRCDGVQGVVGVNRTPIAIPGRDIARWRRDEAEGRFNFNQKPKSDKDKFAAGLFAAGDEVRIISGPFATYAGSALRSSDKYSVGVELMIFGRAVAFDVALDLVELPVAA